MSDAEVRFHETWLGLVQPAEGLVVSIPVLVDAQCLERHPPSVQQTFLELCPPLGAKDEGRSIRDLTAFLADLLGLTPDLFYAGEALPADLFLHVVEVHQTIRPTLGLRRLDSAAVARKRVAARRRRRWRAGRGMRCWSGICRRGCRSTGRRR